MGTVALVGALLLGGAATATPAGASGGPTGSRDPEGPVAEALERPGSLDSVAEVRTLADETTGETGVRVGVVVDTNGEAPGGISVERIVADADQVGELVGTVEDVPGVASAAVDVPVRLLADPQASAQYALGRIGATNLASDQDGLGVVVAVLDTGVAGSHPDLTPPLRDGSPRVLPGRTFVYNEVSNGGPGDVDPHGHGTHVAGIVAAARDNGIGGRGVAPGAQILPVRVLSSTGSGSSTDLAAGIRWAHQQGADVINMSLGAPSNSIPRDVASAIQNATTTVAPGASAPAVVVASAGNNGTGSLPSWPASHPRSIAVAATNSSDVVASFSTRGDYVDVAAPGVNILSTCRAGNQCSMSGTSMASPVVAAAVAVLRQQVPTRTPDDVASLLRSTAVDVSTPGVDADSGAGRIDLARAAATGAPATPVAPVPVAAPPTTTPAPPQAAPPVRLTGGIDAAVVDRRRFVLGGWVSEPDGPAVIRVTVIGGGRLLNVDETSTGGRWDRTVDLSTGANLVCVTGYDNPTNEPVVLGCRNVTVK
jgi:subtilisin family serine protease